MGRYQTGNGVASSGEYKVVLESSWGTGSFPRRTGLSESKAACRHFFLNSSCPHGGPGGEVGEGAIDATLTSPLGEAPYVERDLLLFEPGICSFQ